MCNFSAKRGEVTKITPVGGEFRSRKMFSGETASETMTEAGLESIKRNGPTPQFNKPSMKSKLTIAGLMIGSIVGFLLRPSVPLMGQLPFSTVITRGANLRGLDQLLLGYARTSFNYLVAGMILGAIVGLIAAFAVSSQKS